MTFLNFGQKAGFYRQAYSKLPKVAANFVELLRAFRMSKVTPAIYGDLQEDFINILARIALRIAVKKQTESTSENKVEGSSEILQKKI